MGDNLSGALGVDPSSNDVSGGRDQSGGDDNLGGSRPDHPFNGILFLVGNRVTFEQFEELKAAFADQMDRHGIKISVLTLHGSVTDVEVRHPLSERDKRMLNTVGILFLMLLGLIVFRFTYDLVVMFR